MPSSFHKSRSPGMEIIFFFLGLLLGLTLVVIASASPTSTSTFRTTSSATAVGKRRLLTKLEVVEFCKRKNTSGSFPHPTDHTCSRYVDCSSVQDGIFKEKACPECNPINKSTCPHGHLYFDPVSSSCQPWKNTRLCSPEKEETTTITTIDPVDFDKNDNIWTSSGTFPSSLSSKNDENDHHEMTSKTPPKTCNPRDYVQHGYCKTYFTCDRKTSLEKKNACSGRLYWNPDVNSIHGGVCDYLKNIDNSTLFQYKRDPGCSLNLSYFRRSEEECSSHYFYHHPNLTNGTEFGLRCPEDLLWSKDAQTCVMCHQVMKRDGLTPCCPLVKGEDEKR